MKHEVLKFVEQFPHNVLLLLTPSNPSSRDTVHSFHKLKTVYNKENLERQETNKYGRGTVRHLPKTDESIVRPMGERR